MSVKAKIMVVEDNIDEAKLIKMTLEPEGYEVVTALDGKEAKEKTTKEKPDFFILDIITKNDPWMATSNFSTFDLKAF